MNSRELPKLKGKRIQLNPKARWTSGGEIDKLWLVRDATEEEVILSLIGGPLGPDVTLKRDHIHNYRTGSDGRSDGTLVLLSNVTVTMYATSGGYRVDPIHPILDRPQSASPSRPPAAQNFGIGSESCRINPTLTREEVEILISAADRGEIIVLSDQNGRFVCAGSSNFWDQNDRAVAVRYLEALELLRRRGLVKYDEGNLYSLTTAGFEMARRLGRP